MATTISTVGRRQPPQVCAPLVPRASIGVSRIPPGPWRFCSDECQTPISSCTPGDSAGTVPIRHSRPRMTRNFMTRGSCLCRLTLFGHDMAYRWVTLRAAAASLVLFSGWLTPTLVMSQTVAPTPAPMPLAKAPPGSPTAVLTSGLSSSSSPSTTAPRKLPATSVLTASTGDPIIGDWDVTYGAPG